MATDNLLQGVLQRLSFGDDGAQGTLAFPLLGKSWCSLELPWRDNHPQLSCIPEGNFLCTPYQSPKHGPVYLINDVPGRSLAEIHIANWAGDTTLGLHSDLLGCCALGKNFGKIEPYPNQIAVLASGVAFREFMTALDGRDFLLSVRGLPTASQFKGGQ